MLGKTGRGIDTMQGRQVRNLNNEKGVRHGQVRIFEFFLTKKVKKC